MITVNLRPDLKRKRARRAPRRASLEGVRGLGSKVKDPAAAGRRAELGGRARLAGLRRRRHDARARARSSRSSSRPAPRTSGSRPSSAEKRHQETIRDSLVAQIGIIRTVDGDRYVWPHVLDEVTRALPAYTWLVDLGRRGAAAAPAAARPPPAGRRRHRRRPAGRGPPVQFEVNGRTVDIQAYTRFLRQLEASPWITDVTPVSAQTVVEKERPVTAFTIRATFQPGGLGVHPDRPPQPVGEVGAMASLTSQKSTPRPA